MTQTQIPKTFGKVFTGTHRRIYTATRGRLGSKLFLDDPKGGKIVILTTTGRRSGKKRAHPLIAVEHPEGWVITASNSGHDHPPDWFHNLTSDPRATIQLGGEIHDVEARVTRGEERSKLWNQLVDVYADYSAYRDVTDRDIPVLVLERRAGRDT